MRHYQNVNDTLNNAPQDYEPRMMEREHEGRMIPIIDEWCMGYYLGMAADLQAWTPLHVDVGGSLGRASRSRVAIKTMPAKSSGYR